MNALNQQKALTTVQRISLVKEAVKVRKREMERKAVQDLLTKSLKRLKTIEFDVITAD